MTRASHNGVFEKGRRPPCGLLRGWGFQRLRRWDRLCKKSRMRPERNNLQDCQNEFGRHEFARLLCREIARIPRVFYPSDNDSKL